MAILCDDLHIKACDLWYIVGVIATDGCLSPDGRHIDIRRALGVNNKIGIKCGINEYRAFRFQIGSRKFYDFLLSIGLCSNKSLILGKLAVPKQFTVDFIRGVIDGDGCIRRWKHPTNFKEQWSLRIYSGAPMFLCWLQSLIETNIGVHGRSIMKQKPSASLNLAKWRRD